jgi:glycosyltransferase involved in cell wall biosynthesis
MKQNDLISVIVPIYNNEIYLRKCLDSILSQTFANWEAILVNDGSTDGTGKIIDEYAKKDSRFIAIHKSNEGTLLARKTGLKNSKGEFIANIDHDDVYDLQFLEKMHAKIIEANSDFAYCKCQVADKKYAAFYITDYKWKTDASENISMLLTSGSGTGDLTWNKLIRRELYEKVIFPSVHLVVGEDAVQMIQIAYHATSAAFIPENLYFHRMDTGPTGTAAPESVSSRKASIASMLIIYKTLEKIFSGAVPRNVQNAFYRKCKHIPYNYFILDKKIRTAFKKELRPFLPELIKQENKLNLKICLFLASNGIEFPFRLREALKEKIKNKRRNK